MTNAIRFGLIASALIVAGGVVLFAMARGTDPSAYQITIEQVRRIQQLATDWSVETARVRSDQLADYDALVAFIPRMDELKTSLLTTVQGIPAIPDRLANDVSAYVSAIDAKEERIERFKTANSVVRNSARYLPLAAANIVQDEQADAELAREIGNLAADINEYLASPSDPAKGRLKAVVERLPVRAVGAPERLENAILNLKAHADVLLDRQAPTDEIFDQATSNDISDLSVRLIADLGTELADVQRRGGWYQNGILGAAAALLLLWVVLAVARTRPSAADDVQAAAQDDVVPRAVQDDARAPVQDDAPVPAPALDRAAAASDKLLVAQRILAELVGQQIAATSENIAAGTDGLPEGNGAADDIRRRAGEISELADRLRTHSKVRDATYALLDVNDCVDEAVQATGADGVATVTTETGEVPEVFGSRTEICLLLEEIIENSVDAIREKGHDGDGEGEIRIATSGDGETATVTVIDNGVGMAPEVQARMCEPFFTSKEHGTGIGLTTTSHLIGKYGGRLSVSSHEGGGTVTRVELPGMSAR